MVVMRLEMGLYRVVLEATGGHGCERNYGKGEKVLGCRRMNCPDCITQEYIEKMRAAGQNISKAELIHWPDAGNWGGVPLVDEFVGPSQSIQTSVRNWPGGDGKEYQWVNNQMAHRIRHGYFPEHPKCKEWIAEENQKKIDSTPESTESK
jgi:hypothetical protein